MLNTCKKRKAHIKFLAQATPLALAAVMSACRSGQIKGTNSLIPPKDYTPAIASPLTSNGENYGASFSSDGKKIIFISRDRVKHSQPQVYEMDVATQKDRRITYQDGEIYDVTYGRSGDEIFYSSSTDELKENPPYIRQALAEKNAISAKSANGIYDIKDLFGDPLPPTEIYSSSLDGRHIERLTESPGFDGQIGIQKNQQGLAAVSVRTGTKQIYLLRNHSTSAKALNTSGASIEAPQFSPDGKSLLMTKATDDLKTSEIWLSSADGTQPKLLISGSPGHSAHHLEANWHPDGQEFVFSSNRDDEKNFEIYIARTDGTCVRRLTYNEALERNPQVSPDGKSLLFTSTRSGSRQVYLMKLAPPPCPGAAKSIH